MNYFTIIPNNNPQKTNSNNKYSQKNSTEKHQLKENNKKTPKDLKETKPEQTEIDFPKTIFGKQSRSFHKEWYLLING